MSLPLPGQGHNGRFLLGVALTLAAVPFPSGAADAAPPKHISGNQTIPVYDYTTAEL